MRGLHLLLLLLIGGSLPATVQAAPAGLHLGAKLYDAASFAVATVCRRGSQEVDIFYVGVLTAIFPSTTSTLLLTGRDWLHRTAPIKHWLLSKRQYQPWIYIGAVCRQSVPQTNGFQMTIWCLTFVFLCSRWPMSLPPALALQQTGRLHAGTPKGVLPPTWLFMPNVS